MATSKSKEISREALFAWVWERPATEVARELGISDVALGKLCRWLQVPKPPRGYWARVKAGQILRRPPLPAFRAETDRSKVTHSSRKHHTIRLSPMQRDFLKRALQVLGEAGIDIGDCDLAYDGIRSLSADLAAQILILIQNRHARWVEEGSTSVRSQVGAERSISTLVAKLLLLAKAQVVILHRFDQRDSSIDRDSAIILRLSAGLQQRIAHLYRLARDHRLSHVAWGLSAAEYAWLVRYLHEPDTYARAKTQLCVSREALWLQARIESLWGEKLFETVRAPLKSIVPVDLIPQREIELPRRVVQSRLKPYAKRLRALQDAERAYDIVSSAAYRMDGTVPDENLALADRLWFRCDGEGPFSKARRAWDQLEVDLEIWEQRLEQEKAELCCQVLGISTGDTVICELSGKIVRLQIDGATLYLHDDEVRFHLWGRRYRKDGLLGKRDESIVLQVGNDMK